MEKEKRNFVKERYVWILQAVLVVVTAAMSFFSLISLGATILLLLILLLNSVLFAVIYSYFKKGEEVLSEETQDKAKKIDEFDKITRQLVKRDLELARANQKLAELDKAKSDFVTVAAHQLRTPLTGIKWSYTALLDPDTGELNADQKDIVQKGLDSITNTITLINDLLNVAHIEEGKTEFHIKRQSIIPIAKQAVGGIKLMADEKKITLSAKIPEAAGFPDLNIDAEKMELVLANILDNAVKYTPNGGRIDFNMAQKQGVIEIVIQDSGIGIPKNQKQRLFTKFFRADNAVGVQTSGTGLGLYMVKKIIDRHGGKIAVDSTEGKGTMFIITIPEISAEKSH
jgi:signal transduction histidine kinase